MGSSQQFSLRWNNYLRHITGAFDSLRTDEDLVDVTLSCEGKKIRAHKMLLSACSSYFRDLFKDNPCQHPVIIFRDVKYQDLEALIDFMYQGEVNVVQEQLTSFLNTAELLAVQGLTDGSSRDGAESDTSDIKANEDSLPATQPEVKALPASITPSSISVTPAITSSSINNSRGGPGSPVAKKRKCSLGVNNVSKEDSAPSDLESLEVIPVIPNVKVEQPDYYEQERDGQYSDSVREQSVISGNVDSFAQGDKRDSSDTYNSNSSDKGQRSNPLLDMNDVVMGVSGPSLDTLPQEPLQEVILENEVEETSMSDVNTGSSLPNYDLKDCCIEELDECSSITQDEKIVSMFEGDDCPVKCEDPYYGCNICKEAKSGKKDSGCPRCPICPNLSAPCSHLLKIHMRDTHGWFTVQRRFNMY